jgi:hypothetical protein
MTLLIHQGLALHPRNVLEKMVVRTENESDIPIRNNGVDRDEGQSSQQQPFHIQYSDILLLRYRFTKEINNKYSFLFIPTKCT